MFQPGEDPLFSFTKILVSWEAQEEYVGVKYQRADPNTYEPKSGFLFLHTRDADQPKRKVIKRVLWQRFAIGTKNLMFFISS